MTGHGASRDYVVTEIPVELLFTELDVRSARTDHLIKSFTDRWYEHHLQYADISILRLVPHRELYRYFAGEPGAAPDAYLDWYEQIHATRGITPPMSRKGLLIQRRMEYENMQSELRSESDFFFRSSGQSEMESGRIFQRFGRTSQGLFFVLPRLSEDSGPNPAAGL